MEKRKKKEKKRINFWDNKNIEEFIVPCTSMDKNLV
jgi:hypothetical protein